MHYRVLPAVTMLVAAAGCSFNLAGMAIPDWMTVSTPPSNNRTGVQIQGGSVYNPFNSLDKLHIEVLRTLAFLLVVAAVMEFIAFFVLLPIFMAASYKEVRDMQRARAIGAAVCTFIAGVGTLVAFGLWLGSWNSQGEGQTGLGVWLTLVAGLLGILAFVLSLLMAIRLPSVRQT